MYRGQLFGTALCLILLAAFSGCTTYQREFPTLDRRAAVRIAPYAMMAANAYNHKEFPVERLGWHLEKTSTNSAHDKTQKHRFSLAYDIYRNDRRHEYAFVFRGTDSYLDFLWANLAIGTSFQYNSAETEFTTFIVETEKKKPPYKNYKVVLVGHSLGAGMSLRESVRYGRDAFVFNPSPRLFGPPVPKFKPARRDVVFEEGEALQPLRDLTSAWYLATKRGDGQVYRVNYHFGNGAETAHGFSKMKKLHDMAWLAQGIVNQAAEVDPRLRGSDFQVAVEEKVKTTR